MNDRSWRAVPLLLLSASCVMPGKQAAVAPIGASTITVPLPEAYTEARAVPAAPARAAPAQPIRVEPIAQPQAVVPAAAPAIYRLSSNSPEDRARSLECLSEAVYYEARSEPLQGQRAVAQVVLNRVRHPAFPNSVCGVVFQGAQRRTGCQFSFTCDGSRYRPREQAAWRRAREVAEAALAGASEPGIGYSTHFHTNAVSPWWKRSLRLVASVGSHIFYGWKGQQGESVRFDQRYAGREPGAEAKVLTVSEPVPARRPRERVAVEGVAVTIHRGTAETVAAAATAVPVRVQEADSGDVRVHRGGTPALPQLAVEPDTFGVRVHRSSDT